VMTREPYRDRLISTMNGPAAATRARGGSWSWLCARIDNATE